MQVSRRKGLKDYTLKVGEIIAIDIQIQSEKRNEEAKIFADRYRKVNAFYFYVKAVANGAVTIVDLKGKGELVVKSDYGMTTAQTIVHKLKEELKDIQSKTNMYLGYRSHPRYQKGTHKQFSVTTLVYSDFVVTRVSLSSAELFSNRTLTMEDVQAIELHNLPKFKSKELFYL